MNVVGRGRFELLTLREVDPAEMGPIEPGSVIATWTRGMTFTDPTGRIECDGDASILATRSADLIERAAGQKIILDITPTSQPTLASAGEIPITQRRDLRRAEIIGPAPGKTVSEIEIRRYSFLNDTIAASDAAADITPGNGLRRRLVELFYLSGPQIIASDIGVSETLSVPAAGEAVIVDRRDPTNTTAVPSISASGIADTREFRGTSRFAWQGSALFTRATGVLDLRSGIDVMYKPQGDEPITRMTCNDLLATLSTDVPQSGSSSGDATLRSVEALGGVLVKRESSELIAGRVFFDALAQTMLASSPENGLVTMNNTRRPPPVQAGKLLWNLRNDRIDLIEAAPIVAPR
jgi:hypothetical protein